MEHTALDLALKSAVASTSVAVLPDVVDRILQPDGVDGIDARLTDDARELGHALRRLVAGDLAGLFDGPSTVEFDPAVPMLTLDLSRVTENATLVAALMTCASAWMEAALTDPDAGRRWVVYDEAWRLMAHPALLRRMDAQWRLARHYGIANLLIFHKLSDLDTVGSHGSAERAIAASLLANAETRIIYRQEADQLPAATGLLGLGSNERDVIPALGIGQGLWRIRERAYLVQHRLTTPEHALFDTTARMLGATR